MSTSGAARRVVTLGETLGVLCTTQPGPLAVGAQARVSFAGSESNVAIGLRRLGCTATWIGRVGDDPFGRLIERELLAEGVDARLTRDSRPTAVLLREQRTAGIARTSYHRTGSAGSRLAPEDVAEDVLDGADLVHVTGITPALGEGPAAAVDRILSLAAEREIPVSFDVNYRSALWSKRQAAEVLRPLLARAQVVFAGEHEARLFCDQAEPASMAKALREDGAAVVVITRGAQGSCAVGDGFEIAQPALPADVVDTVGAGDAFVAGYLAALVTGADPEQCLATASAVAAFAVSTLGDWEGLPRLDELGLLLATEDNLR